ncbi:MAG: hypothetical protein EHM61_14100 [Acidobacteria bacterium]|nr:MAG: hypothetical protein EHM61_14100 [Acidobacteriota bacterium]
MNISGAEIQTILFLLAGFMAVALAWTAYREAEHSSELGVMILMLGVYALASSAATVDSVLFGVLRLIDQPRHVFLARVQLSLMLLFHATMMHFVSLTFLKMAVAGRKRIWRSFWQRVLPIVVYAGVAAFLVVLWSQALVAFRAGGYTQLGVSLDGTGLFWFRLLITLFWFVWIIVVAKIGDDGAPYSLKSGLVRLNLGHWHPDKMLGKRMALLYGPREWNTWKLLNVYMLWTVLVAPKIVNAPAQITAVWLMTPAIFLPILVYFKMKAVFIDVVVKRTVLIALLMTLAALFFWQLVFPFETATTHGTKKAHMVVYLGALALAAAWPSIRSVGGHLIDRFVYRRPDYHEILKALEENLKRCPDADAAVTVLLRDIQKALGIPARVVSAGDSLQPFEPENPPTVLAIAVSVGSRDFGELRLGPRNGSRRYQSEDIRFFEAAAHQLAGTLEGLALRQEREEQRTREQELRALAAQAELRALRAQINPHFLFNALNSVAQLTAEDPAAAETALLNLSEVLRYVLKASQLDLVTLAEEIDFVRTYLSIEKIRFEDRLRVDIQLPDRLRDTAIPPMLIQPLVENSVKHGLSAKATGGLLSIVAEAINDVVRITVRDDGVGFDPRPSARESGRGLGLENVRVRLERLYGPGHLLVKSEPGRGSEVILLIPAKSA